MSEAPEVKQTHYRYSWPDTVKAVECLEQLGKFYNIKKGWTERQYTTYDLPTVMRPFRKSVTRRKRVPVWLIEEHE